VTLDLQAYAGVPVSRETQERIALFTTLLKEENARQNLISASTVDHLWARHVADSAQLARFEPAPGASWIDIGSGAGLPGIILACLVTGPVALVEPRRLRAEFLSRAVHELVLEDRTTVICLKAQNVVGKYGVITARAVASVETILRMTIHLSRPGTVWVLPKGRKAKSELAEARRNWHCDATSEGSLTDPESEVLVLRNVRPKGRG
jgi:16S rRNA (guanine527-N7)-methyltransferase